jgi:hypothetical protein
MVGIWLSERQIAKDAVDQEMSHPGKSCCTMSRIALAVAETTKV